MSPEQARGGEVDKRTDIWGFGCLLFELLSGKRAFPGETRQDTIAAVLEREPDWQALPARVSGQVRELLRQCLAKDLARRLHNIGDARRTIENVQQGWNRWRVAAIVAVALAIVAIGTVLWLRIATARRSEPVTLPSEYTQITNFSDSAVAPSLSPDGRMVTFKRGEDAFSSPGQIYIKMLPNGESVQLTNDDSYKYAPVFTPDGSRVAYTCCGFDTYTVPVMGGQPTRLLPNASGLTWITSQQVLFAEIKTELHMGIVTSRESRADRREIYFPANKRAMAHYAYASPDRKSILVVEMDQTHVFHQPCRLLPFDGSSIGRQVGPLGTCTSAAWSPDGKWMYFGVTVGRRAHLWRQKFPDGAPEQITFGPVEEEGIAVAPDGRSLVTSVGTRRSSLWVHDPKGERPISSEGYALAPHLSRDGKRVFYLFAHDLVLSAEASWMVWSGELRSVDLDSGKADSVLPGVSMTDYDISVTRKRRPSRQLKLEGRRRSGWQPLIAARHPDRLLRAEIKYPSALTAISCSARSRKKQMDSSGSRKMAGGDSE